MHSSSQRLREDASPGYCELGKAHELGDPPQTGLSHRLLFTNQTQTFGTFVTTS